MFQIRVTNVNYLSVPHVRPSIIHSHSHVSQLCWHDLSINPRDENEDKPKEWSGNERMQTCSGHVLLNRRRPETSIKRPAVLLIVPSDCHRRQPAWDGNRTGTKATGNNVPLLKKSSVQSTIKDLCTAHLQGRPLLRPHSSKRRAFRHLFKFSIPVAYPLMIN